VAGPGHVVTLLRHADQQQPLQRRASQVETTGAFRFGTRGETLLVHRLTAPVEHLEVQAGLAVHHLHRARQPLPVEAGAQDVVANHDTLPGGGEALRVEALDRQADLVDIQRRATVGEGVEQHALLHRR